VPCGAGIDPNLTFAIETFSGTVLAKQNSGDIAESGVATWQQYGVFFKTPANVTEVIVRITNNAPGGCGNDLALDDITFRPCGPLVNAIISSNGKDSAIFCEGSPNSLILHSKLSWRVFESGLSMAGKYRHRPNLEKYSRARPA
jgi:hypothetical protein